MKFYVTAGVLAVTLLIYFIGNSTSNGRYKVEDFTHAGPGDTVQDIDGNVYRVVTIGTQKWMGQNLKVTRYRNGDSIRNGSVGFDWFVNNRKIGAYTYPDKNPDNDKAFGKLYNIAAILDPREVCPAGWHLPSDEEWKTLELFLGMPKENADKRGNRGNVGYKLLEDGSTQLNLQNAGYLLYTPASGTYYDFGKHGLFWSSTKLEEIGVYYRGVNLAGPQPIYRQYCDGYAMSIRCLKD